MIIPFQAVFHIRRVFKRSKDNKKLDLKESLVKLYSMGELLGLRSKPHIHYELERS